MPSEAKKREMQKKKDAQKSRQKGAPVTASSSTNGEASKEKVSATNGANNGVAPAEMTEEELLCAKLDEEARISADARACTGSLAVHPRSRDIKIANFSITFFGCELLQVSDILLQRTVATVIGKTMGSN